MQGLPIENGSLVLHQGRVVEVLHRPLPDAIDLGDVCILPSLVNSHTHLEFSDLTQPIDSGGTFPDWIARVVALRRQQKEHMLEAKWLDARKESIRKGLQESHAFGVAALVDMVTQPWKAEWVRDWIVGSQGTMPKLVYSLAEMMSFDEAKARLSREFAERLHGECASTNPGDEDDPKDVNMPLQAGLSPHAPYTMSIEYLAECVKLCQRRKWLLSMHLAESKEEMEWISNRSGPFRELLDRFAPNFSRDEPRYELADLIGQLRQSPKSMVVHGNYLDSSAMESLTKAGNPTAVVYCPRTHAAFGQTKHPWRELKRRGITVLLGTDSRASNPDLSIIEEARCLMAMDRRASPLEVMSMITTDAAKFLGHEQIVGSIDVGSIAPTCLVACHARSADKVIDDILSNREPLTLIDGCHSTSLTYLLAKKRSKMGGTTLER